MNTLLLLALVANIMGLLVVTTRPAGNGRTAFLPAMKERGNVTYLIDPSIAWRVEVPPFYRTKREGDTVIAPSQIQGPFRTALVIAQETDLEAVTARTGQTFIPLTRTAPVWEETLLRWYTWNEGWPPWTLYAVQEE
jgi:hypothetical protein